MSGQNQPNVPEGTSRSMHPTRRYAGVPRAYVSTWSRARGLGMFALLAILFIVHPPMAEADVNYVYDELGRLKTVTDPAGNIAQYNYL